MKKKTFIKRHRRTFRHNGNQLLLLVIIPEQSDNFTSDPNLVQKLTDILYFCTRKRFKGMKIHAHKVLRIGGVTAVVIVLLLGSAVAAVYSPWGEDAIRKYLVKMLSNDSVSVAIKKLAIDMPLRLSLEDVAYITESQTITAKQADIDLAVLKTIKSGIISADSVNVQGLGFDMPGELTGTKVIISAPRAHIKDATMRLDTLNIDIPDVQIHDGQVNVEITPVDTVPPDTSEPTELYINVLHGDLYNCRYSMRMPPTIDTLTAIIPHGEINDLSLDLLRQTIDINRFTTANLDAEYVVPAVITPVPPVEPSSAPPWTITIKDIAISNARGTYRLAGVTPQEGLDFNYLSADSLDIAIHDFYNQATTVKIPISLSGRERCGVFISAAGLLDIDAEATRLNDFTLSTPNNSDLGFSAVIGLGDWVTQPDTPMGVNAKGYLADADAALMFPMAADILNTMPKDGRIYLVADIDGSVGALNIKKVGFALNECIRMSASGKVYNAFDDKRLAGHINLDGALLNLTPVLYAMGDFDGIVIPRTDFDGDISLSGSRIDAQLNGRVQDGSLNLDCDYNSSGDIYAVELILDKFPVNAFMPEGGIGDVSLEAKASGQGFDFLSDKTVLDSSLDLVSANVQGHTYSDLSLTASLAEGVADIAAAAHNPDCAFDFNAGGNVVGEAYEWTGTLKDAKVDLHALGLAEEPMTISANLDFGGKYDTTARKYRAKLNLDKFKMVDQVGEININNVTARAFGNDSAFNMMINNRDLYIHLSSEASIDSIMTSMTAISDEMTRQVTARTIDVESFQKLLPPFAVEVDAGCDNLLTDILKDSRMSMENLHLELFNDPTLALQGHILGLKAPTMQLDSIALDMNQVGPLIIYSGRVENLPGSFDEWAHVNLSGELGQNKFTALLNQHDIEDKQGYMAGIECELADSVATLKINTLAPVIAYKNWTVNEDNFLRWDFDHKHLDANLHLLCDPSAVNIYTDHDETAAEHHEALVIALKDIQLADWIQMNPFAPSVSGTLNADMSLSAEENALNGQGSFNIVDLTYGKERVGTVGADIGVTTAPGGLMRATTDISIDGNRVITLSGALNDTVTGSPLAMDLSVIHLPLEAVNPFMPAQTARLRGTLNGQMKVNGQSDTPTLDGWLQFDNAAVKVAMLNSEYPISSVKVPIEENLVTFSDFGISGVNGNPLRLNGTVDIKDMSAPKINLTINAEDFQFCNTNKAARGASIYGRGSVDFDAVIKGNANFMAVNADIAVRSGTNITYVMTDASSVVSSHANDGMVTFVNFNDTAAVELADSLAVKQMAIMLQGSLTCQTGTTINADLSASGRDKVSVQPEGSITFKMLPFGDPTVTGRINIPNGFLRYSPPFMSEKLFNIQEGSYIAFNGKMMNPTLNLKAVDVVKANVSQSGQASRPINFDVSVAISGTFDRMDVVFDLATDEDVSVSNELQSMSTEQRANEAMNMLLYGIYTGASGSGTGNLGENALYSFLTARLNSWAAGAVKGVDLSFGVDQYNTSTSTTTSYSYEVSKSLFNDRFKIVIGGNYSTDANAEENFSENLIKDISFEYFLNNARTMYIRIFRHTGYESILEGEITKTGAGFVYKRKLTTLRDLFRSRNKQKNAYENK